MPAIYSSRHYGLLDRIIIEIDTAMTTVIGNITGDRTNPANAIEEHSLTNQECKQSAGLMRVDHVGEVCAQALYRSQMWFAQSTVTYRMLENACHEEQDHLAWTSQRLNELNSHRSYLNIFWYSQSFMTGLMAGMCGDGWSLGFVEETEQQVTRHLDSHLTRLSKRDRKSHAILEQMRQDEIEHGHSANHAGAKKLPVVIKRMMSVQAKVMTTLAYWI